MEYLNWTPGIGDPTIDGWVTVILYISASLSCWSSGRTLRCSSEKLFWDLIGFLLLGLGINKQLDLQTAFTEVGKLVAHLQGWSGQRHLVQIGFIEILGASCIAATIILFYWIRNAPLQTCVASVGITMVIIFIFIRAATFYHVDQLLGPTIHFEHWNWVLEIPGIGVVLLASFWRTKEPGR